MLSHLELFLQENPQLKKVVDADKKDMDVLIWAYEKGYIPLVKAPEGQLCFTKESLDRAYMWKEKDNG